MVATILLAVTALHLSASMLSRSSSAMSTNLPRFIFATSLDWTTGRPSPAIKGGGSGCFLAGDGSVSYLISPMCIGQPASKRTYFSSKNIK